MKQTVEFTGYSAEDTGGAEFKVVPLRCVVEHSFARLKRCRQFGQGTERLSEAI
jgi:hypothetical protein